MKPPFQLAVTASQPAANHTGPTATVANLPPVQTAVGSYRRFKRRQGSNCRFKQRFVVISSNVESDYLFS
jgi:hypothetical protein